MRCFVIQGFGKKQDYEQGKTFDLDASYEVIKEAIEAADIECFRADELNTNQLIDQAMYNNLLASDLVVADITTLNFNAAFELGVRMALRPHATIVVGEKGLNFPFDINHIPVHAYEHLGVDLGRREAKRFGKELAELAKKIMANPQSDSPVYRFLDNLPAEGFIGITMGEVGTAAAAGGGVSLREMKDRAKKAMDESRFSEAIPLWEEARELAGKDDYIVQQLALATYKSEDPDPETALREAEQILASLLPQMSFDPETLGLGAAVHKRLFELLDDRSSLEQAIFALERGFFIKNDYYNGINLAFMLDTKAVRSEAEPKAELRGVARYVRRKVKEICEKAIVAAELDAEDNYWILATLYEACVGLGDEGAAADWKTKSKEVASADWMLQTTEGQIGKLRALLSE